MISDGNELSTDSDHEHCHRERRLLQTHNHSTMAVATGAEVVFTYFDIPATIGLGASNWKWWPNGIPSNPVQRKPWNSRSSRLSTAIRKNEGAAIHTGSRRLFVF